MKKLIVVFIITLTTSLVFSQRRGANRSREQIEVARIGLITERLGLSVKQAEKFWPLYKEFGDKRRHLMEDFRKQRENFDAANSTEEQRQEMLKLGYERKQQGLDLEKEYSEKMLSVISSQQLIQLRKAEGEFREMLFQRIQKRQRQQRQGGDLKKMQRRRNNFPRRF